MRSMPDNYRAQTGVRPIASSLRLFFWFPPAGFYIKLGHRNFQLAVRLGADFQQPALRGYEKMISRVQSGAVLGIDGYSVEVEVNLAMGIPGMSIVGLPDAAVKESSDRVAAAIKNTNLDMPLKKITVNLAPADIKKEGSAFDLPIAIGILAANGLIDKEALAKHMILGELSLDGRVKRIKGALSIATQARDSGLAGLLLPAENSAEAAVVEGVNVYPVKDLPAVVAFLNGDLAIEPAKSNAENEF